ncbi:hypothetical protein NSND_63494 [Nitrospira sp. ND1]|nr:hypothetical protein NSND_63494 [Nitrospira sp. ND1]
MKGTTSSPLLARSFAPHFSLFKTGQPPLLLSFASLSTFTHPTLLPLFTSEMTAWKDSLPYKTNKEPILSTSKRRGKQ